MSPLIVTDPADARLSGTQPLNGNQELIAHPSRTMIYYGGAGTVTAWNYETDSTYAVDLSDSRVDVSSMDISADGATLAAACGGNIYILSIASDSPTIIKTIPSSHGNVRSLCLGSGDVFYVSYETTNTIDTYTVGSGYIGNGFDAGYNCILEADEPRTHLLAGIMGSADNTRILEFDISTGASTTPSYLGESPSLGGYLAQFEATGDRVYVACTNAAGVQVLSAPGLGIVSTYGMLEHPSGVALSRDSSLVYGISTGGSYSTGSSVIYAFDSSGNKLSTRYVAYSAGPVVPTAHSWAIGTSYPLRLETIGPDIEAYAPAAGAAYTYTPSSVRFNITHDPVIDAASVAVTLDGAPYTAVRMETYVYQINLTSAPSAGSHAVVVTVPWGSMEVSASWTFVSGSTSVSALRPSLSLVDPTPDASTNTSPSQIVVGVAMPGPPAFRTDVTVTLNDLTLTAVADPDDPSRYIATLPAGLELTGSNNVTAKADVDGFIITKAWSFTVDEGSGTWTSYETISYGDNFSIPSPTAWAEQKDVGGWELVITGPSSNGVGTKVFVDIAHDTSVRGNRAYINTYAQTALTDTIDGGDPAEMVGDVNYTAISNLTAGVWKIRLTDQGVQEAYALIVDEVNGNRWLIKCTASDTSFIDIWPTFEHMISGVRIIAPGSIPAEAGESPQGYAYYRMLGDYQLMVPDNWTIKREVTSGDVTVSLKLTGPQVGEFHVTILLQNGTDPTIQDDREWLLSLVQSKFLPQLEAKGIEASVYEEPRILSISNYTTLVFSIKWTDLQNNVSFVQEIYYIVDEGGHRYWMFTCESPEGAYPAYVQIFDKVALSFTPLGGSSTTTSDGWFLSDPTTVLILAVLAVTGAAAAMVFLVARWYRSKK